MRSERSEPEGTEQYGEDDHAAGDHVLSRGVGEERHTVPMHFVLVPPSICLAVDHATRHRPLVDADPEHEPQMEPDHADQDSGNEEDVHREESRQCAPRDDRTTEQHLNERVADTRGTRCDRRPDPEPPVRVLIPPQDLAREGHAERAQEQEHADDPRELTRVFVGAKQKDLDHVQRHDRDHRVGAPEVDGAQEPAERSLEVQIE